MDNASKREAVIALERRILRQLCSAGADDQAFARVLCELAGYRWLRAEHQIVWEALLRLPQGSTRLRELLPTEAARLGFPDVDWCDYFSDWPATPKAEESLNAENAGRRRGRGGHANSGTTGEATGLAALVRKLKELIQK